MVAKLLLINPIENPTGKRGEKKMAAKRKKRKSGKPSAAQLAQRKKFAAASKAGTLKKGKRKAGKKHSKVKHSRKKMTAAQRAAKRSKTRKLENVKHHVAGYYPNPVRGSRKMSKRRTHNPISKLGLPSAKGVYKNLMMPAAIGAVGAVAIDAITSRLPIPANMRSGNMRYVTKAIAIVGIGWLAGKVVKKSTADAAVIGSLTVLFYGLSRDMLAKVLPAGISLGEMGDVGEMSMYSAGMLSGDDMGEYQSASMGEYMTAGMGEYEMAGNGDNY